MFPLGLDLPGQPSPLGTKAVFLKYFNQVPSNKATRDFNNMAASVLILVVGILLAFNKVIALSKSLRIKRATSLRGNRLLASLNASLSSGNGWVIMGKSPNS